MTVVGTAEIHADVPVTAKLKPAVTHCPEQDKLDLVGELA